MLLEAGAAAGPHADAQREVLLALLGQQGLDLLRGVVCDVDYGLLLLVHRPSLGDEVVRYSEYRDYYTPHCIVQRRLTARSLPRNTLRRRVFHAEASLSARARSEAGFAAPSTLRQPGRRS
jgi:hypothetical protein